MAAPWVERNLAYAQHPQFRGSQYEGYFSLDGEREYHDRELDEWRERALVSSPVVTTSLGWSPDLWVAVEAIMYVLCTFLAYGIIRTLGPSFQLWLEEVL